MGDDLGHLNLASLGQSFSRLQDVQKPSSRWCTSGDSDGKNKSNLRRKWMKNFLWHFFIGVSLEAFLNKEFNVHWKISMQVLGIQQRIF